MVFPGSFSRLQHLLVVYHLGLYGCIAPTVPKVHPEMVIAAHDEDIEIVAIASCSYP
jgi:hypothetical protein